MGDSLGIRVGVARAKGNRWRRVVSGRIVVGEVVVMPCLEKMGSARGVGKRQTRIQFGL